MINKLNITLVLFLLVAMPSFAQQSGFFSQYINTQLVQNPAAAGIKDVFSITGLHRQQWAGLRGAPNTSGGIIQSPLKYESVGLGAEYYNESIGSNNIMTVAANFAYRVRIGNEGKLAFGIKGVADFNTNDYSDVSNVGTDANALAVQKTYSGNFGLGVMYRSSKWFAGFSVPRVLHSEKDSILRGGYNNRRHGYLTAGMVFGINQQWKFRASTQIRKVRFSRISAIITGAFISEEGFTIGVNLASSWECAGAFVQFEIAKVFNVGYAFDFNTSALNSVNYGTHEIMLIYTLDKRSKSVPSYF